METRKTIAGTMLFAGLLLIIGAAGGVDQGVATGAEAAWLFVGGYAFMLLGGLWLNAIEKRGNKK